MAKSRFLNGRFAMSDFEWNLSSAIAGILGIISNICMEALLEGQMVNGFPEFFILLNIT